MACLANGAPAASRFAHDMSSLHALARATQPFPAAAVDSRAAAERQLRIRYIDLSVGGQG